MSLTDRIDALLPQTQCTRCGFAACRPYAEALAGGTTSANLCEPGGATLVPRLAALAGLPLLAPAHAPLPLQIAWIREEDCIGCARCLPACPVDAIVGARRFSHTVIAQDCTGCTLCLAPCPVDCIELRDPGADWQAPTAADNRRRFLAHQQRATQRSLARAVGAAAANLGAASDAPGPGNGSNGNGNGSGMAERRAAMIAAARAAAAARRSDA